MDGFAFFRIIVSMKYLILFCFIVPLVGCNNKRTDIQVLPIKEKWIKGKLYQRNNPGKKKTGTKKIILITLAGFDGGYLPHKSLLSLAINGYDVFSLAYSAPPSVLPHKFAEIPIEYLEKAVQWLSNHPLYQNHQIVLLGVSKGAELALLYGSYYQNIHGIIAYSPTCVLLPDIIPSNDSTQVKSPWSYRYKPLGFIPVNKLDTGKQTITYKNYVLSWLSKPQVFRKAMIPVEKINCPMLLLSGSDDKMWGSAKMGEFIQLKLEVNFKPKQAQHIIFKNAGHLFFRFGDDLPKKSRLVWQKTMHQKTYKFLLGGTHQGNIKAMKASQQQVYRFLRNLNKSTPFKGLNQ